jgi:hypothetical protein
MEDETIAVSLASEDNVQKFGQMFVPLAGCEPAVVVFEWPETACVRLSLPEFAVRLIT